MTELRKDLAKALGVSAATVTRDATAGMPTDSLETARDWREQHRRPRATPGAAAPASTQAARSADQLDYRAARTLRESNEAALSGLRLAEQRGDLVRVADVRASLARRAAAFREGLLAIPARLAAVLAAETEVAVVHAELDREIRATLTHLVDAV